jgi:pheromone alpha factor receptor
VLAIFAVLEYVTVDNFPEAGSLVLTMVALLLPLSSLWASLAIDEETSTLNFSHLAGSTPRSQEYEQRKMFGSQLSSTTDPSSRSGFSGDRKSSISPINPTTIDSRIESRRDSTEIDLETMGVRVDKSYTIQSRKGSAGN